MKKRLFFLLLIIALAVNAMAYQTMLVDGRMWSVVYGPGCFTWYDTVMYKVDGDTIIEAETYKRCLIGSGDTWMVKSYLREDVEKQQVWRRATNYPKEELLFDFSLNVGDTLNYRSVVCEHVTSVKDNLGRELKKFNLTDRTYIEGYGYESIETEDYDRDIIFLCVTEGNDTLIDFQENRESHVYKSMVLDGYRWNVVTRNAWLDGARTVVYGTHVEEFDGDSIINGVTYKKLWMYYPESPEERILEGLIREDASAQKVWAYGNGFEALMYDFDVEIGDTISLLSWLHLMKNITAEGLKADYTIVDLVVDNVEKVDIAHYASLKKITLLDPRNKDYKFDIYERFGSLRGWMRSDYDWVDGGGVSFMVCAFDAYDELLFKPTYNNELDEIEDCYIKETKTDVPDVELEMGDVYYNSENRVLVLDVENLMGITVYDAMGKMVVNRELTAGVKAISLDLNMGVYIVNIVTDNKQSIRSKIVVK